MRQKIFTSRKSKIRLDLEFTHYDWWLRSADSYGSRYIGYIDYNGYVYNEHVYYSGGVLPACTI